MKTLEILKTDGRAQGQNGKNGMPIFGCKMMVMLLESRSHTHLVCISGRPKGAARITDVRFHIVEYSLKKNTQT